MASDPTGAGDDPYDLLDDNLRLSSALLLAVTKIEALFPETDGPDLSRHIEIRKVGVELRRLLERPR